MSNTRFSSSFLTTVLLLAVLAPIFYFADPAGSQGLTGPPERTRTGFCFPAGKSEFQTGCRQWLARDASNGGCYTAGRYHVGEDMTARAGDPVFAIADGQVLYRNDSAYWGSGNCALAIVHKLNTGDEFLAIYGHIQTTVQIGDSVTEGQAFATVGPWSAGDHLFFGIRLSLTPPSFWYSLPNSSWPDTDGFVEPFSWITQQSPSPAPDSYEKDDSPAQAGVIQVDGPPQCHSIHVPNDMDWAKFTLASAIRVIVRTTGDYRGHSGDTEMWLYGPDDPTKLVAYNDDAEGGYFSKIDATLNPGTYYVKVQSYSHMVAIPGYKLCVVKYAPPPDHYEADNTPAGAKTIGTGQTFDQWHTINKLGDIDWTKFVLKQPSRVTVITHGDRSYAAIALYGPDDPARVAAAVSDTTGVPFYSSLSRALDAGTYFVQVRQRDSNSLVSGYGLTIQVSSPGFPLIGRDSFEPDDTPAQARTIGLNKAQTRSIDMEGDVDWVKFVLPTAKSIRVQTDGIAGDTQLFLYGPNDPGLLIAANDDSGHGLFSRIDATLAKGAYYVMVAASGSQTLLNYYVLSLMEQ